jgi:hypothetical protein
MPEPQCENAAILNSLSHLVLPLPVNSTSVLVETGACQSPGCMSASGERGTSMVRSSLAASEGGVTTGMRPSEYIGIKWQDVDWDRGECE